jgi:hypothetical protein
MYHPILLYQLIIDTNCWVLTKVGFIANHALITPNKPLKTPCQGV